MKASAPVARKEADSFRTGELDLGDFQSFCHFQWVLETTWIRDDMHELIEHGWTEGEQAIFREQISAVAQGIQVFRVFDHRVGNQERSIDPDQFGLGRGHRRSEVYPNGIDSTEQTNLYHLKVCSFGRVTKTLIPP